MSLLEFTYNNSYQAIIEMAPFEAMYGRKCQTPICWFEVREERLLGPKLIQETTKTIRKIQERLSAAQSRQKSDAYRRRRDLEFAVGDAVFLKIFPSLEVRQRC